MYCSDWGASHRSMEKSDCRRTCFSSHMVYHSMTCRKSMRVATTMICCQPCSALHAAAVPETPSLGRKARALGPNIGPMAQPVPSTSSHGW